jgi:hypothetical protein
MPITHSGGSSQMPSHATAGPTPPPPRLILFTSRCGDPAINLADIFHEPHEGVGVRVRGPVTGDSNFKRQSKILNEEKHFIQPTQNALRDDDGWKIFF